jgi:hypothetical protein
MFVLEKEKVEAVRSILTDEDPMSWDTITQVAKVTGNHDYYTLNKDGEVVSTFLGTRADTSVETAAALATLQAAIEKPGEKPPSRIFEQDSDTELDEGNVDRHATVVPPPANRTTEKHVDGEKAADTNKRDTPLESETQKKSYAAVAATSADQLPEKMKDRGAQKALEACRASDPDLVVHVYGSLNKKQFLSFDTFQNLTKKLAPLILGTMLDKSLGLITFGKPFYESSGGFVVYSCGNKNSRDWLKITLAKLKIDGQSFRAWGPTEMPPTTSLSTWLADSYAEINFDNDSLKQSILHFNPEAPDDLEIVTIKAIPNKKGRLVDFEAGQDFMVFVESSGWTLSYFLGNLEIRKVSEAPTNRAKKKTHQEPAPTTRGSKSSADPQVDVPGGWRKAKSGSGSRKRKGDETKKASPPSKKKTETDRKKHHKAKNKKKATAGKKRRISDSDRRSSSDEDETDTSSGTSETDSN